MPLATPLDEHDLTARPWLAARHWAADIQVQATLHPIVASRLTTGPRIEPQGPTLEDACVLGARVLSGGVPR